MTQFKLNGKPLQIADCWQDITFAQYLKIFDMKDDYADMISTFTGIDRETIAKAKIKGLDAILASLSFLNDPPDFTGYTTDTLCGTKMPRDVTFEQLAPFEDMRLKIKEELSYYENGKPKPDKVKEVAECKAWYCAIYLQYTRDKEYDSEKVKSILPEVMNAPAMTVLLLGSFFLIRHLSLNTTMTASSRTTQLAQKKKKPTSRGSMKRSGRTRKSSR